MKTRILWLIFVSALLCFTSCDQFSIPDNQIKLDQTEFNLPAAGGEIKVSFVPLSAWSVMCSDPSVKLTPSSGEKSDELISLVIKDRIKNEASFHKGERICVLALENFMSVLITMTGL